MDEPEKEKSLKKFIIFLQRHNIPNNCRLLLSSKNMCIYIIECNFCAVMWERRDECEESIGIKEGLLGEL